MAFLTWIHWLAILHIVRYGWANSTNCDFDKRCRCSLRNDLLNVDCSNSGKISVPAVPTNVYTFNVSHNDILLIRNGTFKNLSYLLTLDLSSNRLKTIEPDAFIGLHSLKQFILQNNKLRYHRSVFPTNIFRPLVSLQSLNVQSNSLKYNHTFPDDIIADIVTLESLYVDAIFVTRVLSFGKGYSLLKKLTKLFLGNCFLNEINRNTFVNVPYLEHLQISRCSIRVYNPSALQNLFRMKILNLSYNKLDFNGFSNLVEDTEKMKFLETLILTNTFSTQMNLPKLLFYYLDATNIRELYLNENFFVNATPEVEHIERLPDTLQYLDFSNNKLIDCRFDMPTLKKFNMQYNLLGNFLASESYAPMFENDTSYLLETVDLSFNQMHTLKWSVFNNQLKLRIINLSNNFLSDIAFDISQLTKLEMLDLSNNNITSISNMQAKEAISNFSMKSAFKVDLSNNLFECVCKETVYLRWMLNHVTVFHNIHSFTCKLDSGKVVNRNFVQNVEQVIEGCRDYTILVICISLVLCLAIVTVVAGLIYRYRWKLRYMYYMTKTKWYRHKPPGTEGQYRYDAFISYSDNEQNFIVKECIPKLERERNLKLCIHQRDFIPGEEITVNITSAIHDSKKTICIITRSFLDSYYCNFEFNMARMENIYHRKGQHILFLVFYEKIPAKDLSLVMLELIQKHSYIEYPNDEQGNELFWDKIKEAIE
ncbi:toll-like receptor 4 [Mytilus galloprovincialis]|uniref:toll-like receptor 4 n=1 Tax=Mytilus galloprovincialis TaxID=29158 RepID=UPI003F7C41E8